MEDNQTEILGSAVKVQGTLTTHAAALAATTQIADELTNLGNIINKINTTEGIAQQNYTGDTSDKKTKRTAVETSTRKVGTAAAAYYLSIGDEGKRKALLFNKSQLAEMRDTALFHKANQTHLLAVPVKTLLGPFQCTASDVNNLDTLNIAFGGVIEKPFRNKDLVKTNVKIQANNFVTLNDCLVRIDQYMAPYEFTNYDLWLEYTNNRLQDNTGAHANVLLHLSHAVNATSVYNINTDAFAMEPTDEITGDNTGDVVLTIGFGPNATTINSVKYLKINSGHKSKATAEDLGFDGTNTFLNIVNTTGGEGHMDVKVTE